MDKTIKTLIVDDDNIVRTFMVKLIINKFGYDVVQAGNGIEALKVLEHDSPDIVFLDISMPLMNGIEFLSTVRNHAKYKHLPIIAITAHSDKATVKQLVDLGIQDYILKPLSYNETYARLREIISGYKSRISKNRSRKELPDKKQPKRNLLLIDVDKAFRNFLRRLLSFEFEIIEGSSTFECLDLYVKHEPEVVIISLELNATQDNFLLNKLRELDMTEELKVFATTFNELNLKRTRGYDGVMLKSFFPSKMMKQISDRFYQHGKMGETYLHIINKMGGEKLGSVVKYIFDLESGMEVVRKHSEIFASVKLDLEVVSYFATSDSSVLIQLILAGEQNAILNIKSSEISEETDLNTKFEYLNESIGDFLKYEFEKFGIDLNKTKKFNSSDKQANYDRQTIKFHFESDESNLYKSVLQIYVQKSP
ncbi:MAG: hypothetical protein SCALA702_26440 [Melioribacteraceae bacterium]|nr:MAG: hypothetical protein SCALA702_26440 [Melioribacteraceae bacterium]